MSKRRSFGMTLRQKRNYVGYVFVLPFIVGFLLFFMLPFIQSIVFSISELVIGRDGYELNYVDTRTTTRRCLSVRSLERFSLDRLDR